MLPAADRGFVCELAVFDWVDADLVDEVLGSTDAGARIAALSPLDGLLASMNEQGSVRRLHPLVRECCTALLAREDRPRQRSLHAGIVRGWSGGDGTSRLGATRVRRATVGSSAS